MRIPIDTLVREVTVNYREPPHSGFTFTVHRGDGSQVRLDTETIDVAGKIVVLTTPSDADMDADMGEALSEAVQDAGGLFLLHLGEGWQVNAETVADIRALLDEADADTP